MVSDFFNGAFYRIAHCLPIKKNKIVFLSHLGKSYSCNPKYLCEYLAKECGDKFDLVWIYTQDKPTDIPSHVRAVKHYSRRSIYEICTTGYLVSNTRMSNWFRFNKRPGQVYLQTWHSSLRLKCIEADAILPKEYVEAAKKDSRQIDYIVSGCEFSSKIYANSFWYDGKILSTGTPRIDYLKNIDENTVKSIYTKAGLNDSEHYVLYAPTFRKDNNLSSYNIDYARLVAALNKKFGGVWKVLFRLHPNLQDIVRVEDDGDCCINMTMYPDMQELLVISDILITDYSSSMFDMAFLGRPCILYVGDLQNYLATERNLYFDIKSLPFIVAENNDQLVDCVASYQQDTYNERIEEFMRQIGSYEEGNACQKIAKEVFGL